MQYNKGKLFTFFFLPLLTLGLAFAAPSASAAGDEALASYPKNLARLHLGASLYRYDPGSGTYQPADVASSWMDDDETTGQATKTGRQHYLLVLSQPFLVRNFTLSSDGSRGTVTVYAGDERATPESSTWTPVLSEVPISELNEQTPTGSLNRYGRYLLIETNLDQTGPLWSLYVFGREPATDFNLERRPMPVDSSSVFGQKVRQNTIIDVANIYSDARIVHMANGGAEADWHAMIDESPETFWIVNGAEDQATPAFAVELADQTMPIRRISVMADAGPGVMEFFLIGDPATNSADTTIPVATSSPRPDFRSLDLDGMVPVCTLGFDGVSDREAIDIASAEGRYLLGRWRPTVGGENIKIRQLDVFGDPDFDNFQVVAAPAPIAEMDNAADKVVYDPGKNYKTLLDPIAEGPAEIAQFSPTGAPPIFSSPVPPLLTVSNNPPDDPDDPDDPRDDPTPTPTPTPTPQTPSSSSP